MRNWFAYLATVFLSHSAFAQSSSNFVSLPFRLIEFSESERTFDLDLGRIECGRSYAVDIELANRTFEDFLPQTSKSSCGCLVGLVDKKAIPAGKTGTVRLRIASPKQQKVLRQYVQIVSKRGEVNLRVQADARHPVNILPKTLILPREAENKPVTLRVVSQFPSIDLSSCRLRSLSSDFVISAQKPTDNGQIQIFGEFRDRKAGLDGSSSIVIAINCQGRQQPIEQMVSVVQAGQWRLKPTQMLFAKNVSQDMVSCRFFAFTPKHVRTNIPQILETLQVHVVAHSKRLDGQLKDVTEQPYGFSGQVNLPINHGLDSTAAFRVVITGEDNLHIETSARFGF